MGRKRRPFTIMQTTDTDLITPAETARRLGVATDTVRRWVREGRLDALRFGPKVTRLSWADVVRALHSQTAAIDEEGEHDS